MKIKASDYNKKLSGYVIRNAFGKWCVCDGKAPDGIEVEERAVFIGYAVKWFDTFEEAAELVMILDK